MLGCTIHGATTHNALMHVGSTDRGGLGVTLVNHDKLGRQGRTQIGGRALPEHVLNTNSSADTRVGLELLLHYYDMIYMIYIIT